jgi:hypothetical protein
VGKQFSPWPARVKDCGGTDNEKPQCLPPAVSANLARQAKKIASEFETAVGSSGFPSSADLVELVLPDAPRIVDNQPLVFRRPRRVYIKDK